MQFSFLHLIGLDTEDIPPVGEKIAIGGGKREEKCNCIFFYPTFVALSGGRRGHAAEVTRSSVLPEPSISCGSVINRLKEDMVG